jgi:hypothetical protein
MESRFHRTAICAIPGPGRQKVINSLVQGVGIECEIHDVVDDFTEVLNSGGLRDCDLNHRRPQAPKSNSVLPRCPKALRIRTAEQTSFGLAVTTR